MSRQLSHSSDVNRSICSTRIWVVAPYLSLGGETTPAERFVTWGLQPPPTSEERAGLHDNGVAVTVLLLSYTFGKSEQVDLTAKHEGFP
jgi:hypothetical protein